MQSVQRVQVLRNAGSTRAPGGRRNGGDDGGAGGASSRNGLAARTAIFSTLSASAWATPEKNCRRVYDMVAYITEVRISIGCLSSHRLNTPNAIMPSSSGHCERDAATGSENVRRLIFCAAHRL